jgi:acetoin utilization deacetylase AcuC-like enzyme/ankyrin repeat protein
MGRGLRPTTRYSKKSVTFGVLLHSTFNAKGVSKIMNENHLDEELIETDSDDSDYNGTEGESSDLDIEGSGSEDHGSAGAGHRDDGSDDDDEDDSDYEEEDENEDEASGSGSGSGDGGSSDGSGSDDSAELGGDAPFTGYIFPAVHKLVAASNIDGLISYLDEMYDPNQAGPQVWEVSDSLGRNAVHLAIVHGNVRIVKLLMDYDIRLLNEKFTVDNADRWKFSAFRRKFDDMSIIHLAMTIGPWDDLRSTELLDILFSHPGFTTPAFESLVTLDYWKRSPLHIAVMTGKLSLVRYFVTKYPGQMFEFDNFALVPLHYAIDSKNTLLVEYLLSELMSSDHSLMFQALLQSLPEEYHPVTRAVAKCSWEVLVVICRYLGDSFPQKAIDVAHEMGIEINGLNDVSQNLGAAQKCVFDRCRETAIVFDTDCLGHVGVPTESEDGHLRLKRVKLIVENPTRLEVLVGAHGSLRMPEFQNLRLVDSVSPCPLTDIVRVHEWAYISRLIEMTKLLGSSPMMVRIDKGDTNITTGSWLAARKAAGCVLQAMDLVCSETCKNAFVAVRPPGHHVSSRGAVDPNLEDDDTGSNGFCLLNNVAIGAAYAMCVHRHIIQRVAVIDLDIHHGNGTEAIIRGLANPKSIDIPINVCGLSGGLQMQSFHPWLDQETDAKNVFFSSIHRYDGRFYPQSGATGVDGNIVNVGLGSFSSSEDFRNALNHIVFPKMVEFNPDLIIVSAGFDGHVRDRLASGEWEISEDDYYWATEQLVAIANMCCKGRLVSVLEGGYNTKGGWMSPLAQSVVSHVRAMSSSWASKWEEPAITESVDETDDDAHLDVMYSSIDDNETTDLLARADALIHENVNKKPRTDNNDSFMTVSHNDLEFNSLFGGPE